MSPVGVFCCTAAQSGGGRRATAEATSATRVVERLAGAAGGFGDDPLRRARPKGARGMDHPWIPTVAGLLVMLASLASVELGISVALIEISLGVVAGNFLGLQSPPWMDFLASFGSIVLTFLAGAEVDPRVMREKFKESLLIGGFSFAAPFVGAWLFCAWVLGWSTPAAQIAGVALSTTSLAVVYAVLVETGLTLTPIGKLIMASTFVTDFGTALALALLFIRPTWWLVPFLGVSVLVILAMVTFQPWFFSRYGEGVREPEC